MKWLVRLYPLPWRVLYEVEFLAMFEDHQPSTFDYIDLLVSIARTRLNPRFRLSPTTAYAEAPAFRHPLWAFPDNMQDMLFEKELYRTRTNNGVSF